MPEKNPHFTCLSVQLHAAYFRARRTLDSRSKIDEDRCETLEMQLKKLEIIATEAENRYEEVCHAIATANRKACWQLTWGPVSNRISPGKGWFFHLVLVVMFYRSCVAWILGPPGLSFSNLFCSQHNPDSWPDYWAGLVGGARPPAQGHVPPTSHVDTRMFSPLCMSNMSLFVCTDLEGALKTNHISMRDAWRN